MRDKVGRWWSALRGVPAVSSAKGAAAVADDLQRVPLRGRAAMGRVSAADYGAQLDLDGFPPGGLDTFLRMRRDAQVRACLTTKVCAVLSEGAEVHPADDSQAATWAADTVRTQLNAVPGGIAGIVAGTLDALAMGFSVGELVWGWDGSLVSVRWHDPRRVQFHASDTGDVQEVEFLDSGLRFPRSRFLLYAYQSRYGNPYGESDLCPAYRPWATKDQVQRMWLSALDRFGAPIPVAKVPLTWSQSEMDRLTTLLAKIQNETSLVLPADVELDVALQEGRVEPARAFVVATRYQDTQIARAILGQELTTQGNSDGAGSYALGKVHEGVATDWIQSLRSEIAETVLTGQAAAAITEMWYGPLAPVPLIRFPNLTDTEMARRQTLVQSLISGAVVAPSESWIRRFVGVPEVQ